MRLRNALTNADSKSAVKLRIRLKPIEFIALKGNLHR